MERGKPRFSLRFVFIITAYIALGCAVALSRSELWLLLLLPVSFGSVGASVLGVIHRRGKRRAFWVGFLVFGLIYLAVLFQIWPLHDRGSMAALILHVPIGLIGAHLGRYFHNTMEQPNADLE